MITLQGMGQNEAGLYAGSLQSTGPQISTAPDDHSGMDHGENGKGQRETESGKTDCLVAVVESRSLLRDCISHLLSKYRGVSVKRYMTIEELLIDGSNRDLDLVILGAANKSRQAALDEISRLREIDHAYRLIILTDSCDPGFVSDALRLGAQGIVTTSSTADVAVEAFRLVMAGGTFIPAEGLVAATRAVLVNGKTHGQLTVREEQIIALLRCGKPNKQIASELGLSEGTVKVHLHNIMKKCGVANRTQIITLPSLPTLDLLKR